MKYLKEMDSRGLDGLGEKLGSSANSDSSKCIECDEQKQRNPNFSYCPNCGKSFL